MIDHPPPRVLRARSQRPGRRFEPIAERALERDGRQATLLFPGVESGLMVLREFRAPYGVPDLVAVAGPSDLRRRRLRLAVPPITNQIDAAIIAAAHPPHGATVPQLAARLRFARSTVERRLGDLIKRRALLPVASDRFVRPASLTSVGDVFAIELKVSEWRKGLDQCRRYRTWANSYVLVMGDVPDGALEELVRSVRADGGGLMVAGAVVVRPRRRSLKPARQLWSSEHVIQACRLTQ